ncbi:MAG: nuclear transport factor 2 family protein [Planctomycetota bacterium]
MNLTEASAFCRRWLPAWTGGVSAVNQLLSFYATDAFYSDPARPSGITGREALRVHFAALLRVNPSWRWKVDEIFPTERGFVLKWNASLPRKDGVAEVKGIDIVEIKDDAIIRNEVYFDRAAAMP